MSTELDRLFDQLFERLDRQDEKLDALATDVSSLLQSRSYARGAWKAITIVGAILAGAIGVLTAAIKAIAFVRGH